MTTAGGRMIPVGLLRKSKRLIERELVSGSNCNQVELKLEPPSDTLTPATAQVKKEPLLISPKVECEHSTNNIDVKSLSKNAAAPDQMPLEQSIKEESSLKKEPFEKDPRDFVVGSLEVDEEELDLERTLMGGQSFRWVMRTHRDPATKASVNKPHIAFWGIVGDNLLELYRLDSKRVMYVKWNKEGLQTQAEVEELLRDYFQLKYKLLNLYGEWSKRDENFTKCSQYYRGFRILRQDPVENVFSFICATNNNIKRISQMVGNLCLSFGNPLKSCCHMKHLEADGITREMLYSFPTVERLAQADVIDICRNKLSFGYRANYIHETAKKLLARSSEANQTPREYLLSLRQWPYKETAKRLQEFTGIGRKVADCICLMSMDHLDSVPVDCHIYQIVSRDYITSLQRDRKNLTPVLHDIIGNYFVKLFGPLAGWATSVLFVGELKHLKPQSQKSGDEQKRRPARAVAAKPNKRVKEE